MMWIDGICLKAYGEFTDLNVGLGKRLTVVYGINEAGKSTARDAITDFLWGIPPRSPRASTHARPRLVLEGGVHSETFTGRCVRRSSGLARADGASLPVEPWNPDGGLDRGWWRNNFGIDHAALREGGAEVLKATQGTSDIADLIFVARRGEIAHNLLEELKEELKRVYSSDGRHRTELRTALEKLDESKARLQETLMRVSDVEQLRADYDAAERDARDAGKELATAQSMLSRAKAHARVIQHVLAHAGAEAELGEVDATGPRLEPAELSRYQEAQAAHEAAKKQADEARMNAEHLRDEIADLAIDPELLAAGDEIDALARELQARLEDLDQLASKHRPDAERYEDTVRGLLTRLGVSLADGVDNALEHTQVSSDLSATLDHLASQFEAVESKRSTHRENRRAALDRLVDRGIVLDLDASRTLPESEVRSAEHELREAQQAVDEHEREVDRLKQEIADITSPRRALPAHNAESSPQDLAQARAERDAAWDDIRADWTQGPALPAEVRHDLADRFTGLLRDADEAGDREADSREELAARRAVTDFHNLRLQDLWKQVEDHTEALRSCRSRLEQAEAGWSGLWARAGITPAPELNQANLILADLIFVHKQSGAIRDADEHLQELTTPWTVAIRDAGLPESATAATWRARSQTLQAIERARTDLDRTRVEITRIEQRFDSYKDRTLDTLTRHDPSAASSDPHEIANSLRTLQRRLTEHRKHQAKADTLQTQLERQAKGERQANHKALNAEAALEGLRDARQVDDVTLTQMAARAEQATVPIQRMDAAVSAIRNAWPEVAPHEVIRELRGWDQAGVEAELTATNTASAEAQERFEDLSGVRGRKSELLAQAERKQGADEALEQVRAAEAAVTDLASKWLQLKLQIELLNRAIASQGDESALGLLSEAGRILERLTAGRWVALQPAPGHGVRALRVLRADEREATPEELSEGTLDQVYFALRLAAVQELHRQRVAAGKPAVPLVLDDVLMAFDIERTREALALLSDLAQDMQVIVFTHHAHVADQARRLSDVHVTELPVPGAISADRDPEEVRAAAARPDPLASEAAAPAARATQTGQGDLDPKVVRAWAEAEGLMEPGRRGRIPSDILARYQREHTGA